MQSKTVRRKAFLLVIWLYAVCSGDDRSNPKGVVNVNSTANRINNFSFIPLD